MTTFNANTGLTISVKVEISKQLSKMLNVISESLKNLHLGCWGISEQRTDADDRQTTCWSVDDIEEIQCQEGPIKYQ
jgi:hypothetical protein